MCETVGKVWNIVGKGGAGGTGGKSWIAKIGLATWDSVRAKPSETVGARSEEEKDCPHQVEDWEHFRERGRRGNWKKGLDCQDRIGETDCVSTEERIACE